MKITGNDIKNSELLFPVTQPLLGTELLLSLGIPIFNYA